MVTAMTGRDLLTQTDAHITSRASSTHQVTSRTSWERSASVGAAETPWTTRATVRAAYAPPAEASDAGRVITTVAAIFAARSLPLRGTASREEASPVPSSTRSKRQPTRTNPSRDTENTYW